MPRFITGLCVVLSPILLTACGGSDAASEPPPGDPGTAISSGHQTEVAREALRGIRAVAILQSVLRETELSLVAGQLVMASPQREPVLPDVPSSAVTKSCKAGGTVTISRSGPSLVGRQLTAGDVLDFDFSTCALLPVTRVTGN